MKCKYRNELKIINYITTTEKYKAIFFISVILGLYGSIVLGIHQNNFIDSLLLPFTFPLFNLFLFAVIFLNNINTCSIFKKEFPDYILRLGSKKEYVKTIMRITTIMFLFQFMIILFFILMPLFLAKLGNFKISMDPFYNVSNLTYLLFYIFRYIVYGLLLTLISSLIYINSNTKITLLTNGIFLLLMFYLGNNEVQRTSPSLLIWSYFTGTTYTTFSMEVASSILIAIILEIITLIASSMSFRNKRLEVS